VIIPLALQILLQGGIGVIIPLALQILLEGDVGVIIPLAPHMGLPSPLSFSSDPLDLIRI
jgi:hypothetical protein